MPTTRRSSVRLTSAATQRRQTSEPEAKKFINIISLSTINKKMMKIPAGFVRLGPKLSDIVTLKTPAGFNRSIRIKRTGNEVWFENGWSEFAKTHSLSEGHLLLFHYKGNSSFRVIIFDKSASEIIYPLDNVHVIESDDDDDDDDDDEQMVDVMVMDDVEEGIIGCGSSDGGDGGVIDLDELLKKKLRVSIKSEKVTILDDVVEIDSTDEE